MSFVTQMIYETLNTIKEECKSHPAIGDKSACDNCAFKNCMLNESAPEGWDVDAITDIVYDLGWKGRKNH